jgi:hypothetical protein
MKKLFDAKGKKAAALRRRKYELVRKYGIPEDLLPGSLSLTYRKCGKPNCWCARSKRGHPIWLLVFMAGGKRHVEWIPARWAEEIKALVKQGREFKEAMAEVFAANAQLLVLHRSQEQKKKHKGR